MASITRAYTYANSWSSLTVDSGSNPNGTTVDYTGVSFVYISAFGHITTATSAPFTVLLQTSPNGSVWTDGPSVNISNDDERFSLTHTPTAGHIKFRLKATAGIAVVYHGTIIIVYET